MGRMPQNGPIYYGCYHTLDHDKDYEIKTAGRGLANFSEKAGMVGLLELNVVNRPFSWRVVSSMLISVPELTQLFVSCGDIRTVWRFGASKQSLSHRNLEGAGGVG